MYLDSVAGSGVTVIEAGLGEYYLNEWIMFLESNERDIKSQREEAGYRDEGFERHRAAACGSCEVAENRETSSTELSLDEAVGAGQSSIRASRRSYRSI